MPTGNTQQVINYGASANDGQGDPLRTAFIKTDENFDNIWLAGPAGSNVRITNNTIGVIDTNGNLILSPNGIGVIQTNNHVVPRVTRTYDIGSANLTYRTVYANSATFQTVGVAGDLSVGGNLTVQGNIIQVGNIVTETLTIQLANAATTANAANGSGITVGASDNIATLLYNSASNVWATNIGVSATGNVTAPYFIGNGSQLTGLAASYGNANVATFLANYGSNTIATTGNVSAGNVLTSAEVIASGVIQSGTGLSTGGYLSVDGSTSLHDTTITGNLSVSVIRNDDSTVVKIQDGVEIDGDALVNGDVTADAFIGNGNLTLQPDPANAASYLDIFLTSGPDLHLVASNGANLILGKDNGANVMTSWDGNAYVQSWNQDTGNVGGVWTFGGDGNLTVPGNMAISGNTSVLGTQTALLQPNDSIPLSILTSGANGSVTSFWAEDIANVMTSNIAAIYTPLQGTNTVRIVTGSNSGNIAIYDFDKDGMFSTADISASGNITAGNIIMSGSLVGSGASPAPYLSGFSSVSAINVSASGNVTGTYVKGNGSELTNLPAPTVAQDITSNGAMSIMLYDGTIKYNNYATVEPSTGNITGGNITTAGNITGNTAGFALGYRDIPQVSFTGNTTITTTDAGKHYYSTQSTNYTLTIANNASQGFQVGAAITVVNQGTGTITIAQGSGVTLYIAGNATAGNRSVSTFGMATIMKVAADTWFINGTGVS